MGFRQYTVLSVHCCPVGTYATYLWTVWGSTWHSLDGCYFASLQKRCGVLASFSALCSTSNGKVWKISWILHRRYLCSYLCTKLMCGWLGVCFCCTRFKERVFISHKRTQSLLKQFAKSGVSSAELLDFLGCNATSLANSWIASRECLTHISVL